MAAELPDVAGARAALRARLPRGPVLRPDTAAFDAPYPWSTVGMAADARLRLAMSPTAATAARQRPALAGADLAALCHGVDTDTLPMPEVITALGPWGSESVTGAGAEALARVRDLVAAQRPTGDDWELPGRGEQELARLMVTLAWFEEVYRTGRLWPGSALDAVRADAGLGTAAAVVDALTALVPGVVVADLCALVRLACERGDWAALSARAVRSRTVCGPTFTGSRDVHGADADVVVGLRGGGAVLVDVKATVLPDRVRRETLYQLAGYVLLDYNDSYGVSQAGWFLARHGRLVTFGVEELLAAFGARRSVGELRPLLRSALARRPQ